MKTSIFVWTWKNFAFFRDAWNGTTYLRDCIFDKGKGDSETGHSIKWDHCDILATGQSDIHCKIKETLLIRDLKPAFNENIASKKLLLY